MLIVTNNKMTAQKYERKQQVFYDEIPAASLLILARDKIHQGHRLLTHPLSGSVKPYENPYKTFALTQAPEKARQGEAVLTDFDSLHIIENAIATFEKFKDMKRAYPEEILQDFRLVDLSLFDSGVRDRIDFI